MRLVGDFNRSLSEPPDSVALEAMMIPARLPDVVSDDWPSEVDLILSAMEAASATRPPGPGVNRRSSPRKSYRTCARLKLFADNPQDEPTRLYTRDIHDRGVGFITRERLPLGYGGLVELDMPNGRRIKTHCTVYRCRETINGWFEGAIHFTTAQFMD